MKTNIRMGKIISGMARKKRKIIRENCKNLSLHIPAQSLHPIPGKVYTLFRTKVDTPFRVKVDR